MRIFFENSNQFDPKKLSFRSQNLFKKKIFKEKVRRSGPDQVRGPSKKKILTDGPRTGPGPDRSESDLGPLGPLDHTGGDIYSCVSVRVNAMNNSSNNVRVNASNNSSNNIMCLAVIIEAVFPFV